MFICFGCGSIIYSFSSMLCDFHPMSWAPGQFSRTTQIAEFSTSKVAARCEQRESLRANLPLLIQAEGIGGCLGNVLADYLAYIANAWLDKIGSGDGPTSQKCAGGHMVYVAFSCLLTTVCEWSSVFPIWMQLSWSSSVWGYKIEPGHQALV